VHGISPDYTGTNNCELSPLNMTTSEWRRNAAEKN
jgi:hypothetical protein